MKRVVQYALIMLLILIVTSTALLGAQNLSYGLLSGLNMATMIENWDGLVRIESPKIGLVGGAFVEYPILELDGGIPVSLRGEIYYTQLGFSMKHPVMLHCVQIPILARIDIPFLLGGAPYVLIGLAGNYILSMKIGWDSITDELESRVDIKSLISVGYTISNNI